MFFYVTIGLITFLGGYFMIISTIKPNKDQYKLDEITCFEKPIGIVLDSYDSKLSSTFYMYIKFCSSYLLNCSPYLEHSKVFNIMEISSHIINTNFNLRLEKINLAENIHDFIESKLKNYDRILIPGNLKDLYYSEHYNTKDWPHIFVICGFDYTNKLYNILDFTQLHSNDVIYKPFVIQYETLDKIYKSYCNYNGSNDIFILSNPNNLSQFDICKIIDSCLTLYENNLSANPHILFKYINSINEIITNNDKSFLKKNLKEKIFGPLNVEETTQNMFNLIKFKNVFFTELIESSRPFIKDTSLLNSITTKKEILITKWNNLSNIALINMKRVLYMDYQEYINELINLELEIKNLVMLLKSELSKYKLASTENSLINSFILENNEDSIINIENSNIQFNFLKQLEYNCWTGDNAPKILLNSQVIKLDNFTFTAKVSINKKADNCGFLSGFIIKFNNNATFYYGITSYNTLIIDERLKSFGLTETPYTHSEVHLKLVNKNKKCTFYYTNDISTPFTEFFNLEDESKIIEIGLSCKTWTNTAPINIEFTNIEFY